MVPLPSIIHLDADAFFVSVEQALHPELRGKKVAVGGRQRGIISSASYEARACGVYTPMPTQRALKVCPDLIVVGHTSGLYGAYSRKLFDLCETLTPIVERNSIDEGYLDAEPCRFPDLDSLVNAAKGLQMRIFNELGITISFGLATNKLVAAIASKLRKPKGFVVVPSGEEASFLSPLSIGKLPGVGVKTEETLNAKGIRLVSDLFTRSEAELQVLFGDGWRGMLARARGEDDRIVDTEEWDAKSYSQQETFAANIGDFGEIERVAKRMLDELMRKVRADQKRVKTLTVKVRYADFSQTSSAHSLPEATSLEKPFYPWIAHLLRESWKRPAPLRLVSVRLSNVDHSPEQMDLFGESNEKRKRLAQTVDQLKELRGEDFILKAGQIASRGKTQKRDRGQEGFQRPEV
jgi:DNA polymerase-4